MTRLGAGYCRRDAGAVWQGDLDASGWIAVTTVTDADGELNRLARLPLGLAEYGMRQGGRARAAPLMRCFIRSLP